MTLDHIDHLKDGALKAISANMIAVEALAEIANKKTDHPTLTAMDALRRISEVLTKEQENTDQARTSREAGADPRS